MSDAHRFRATATWDESAKEGRVGNDGLAFVHTGAVVLGGKGGSINPEELLASAVATCFVQTWAIFLGKLKVPVERPEVGVECAVEKDPAGGFRVTGIAVTPHVPAALWEERRADVEKTLSLAEKYCIVSKAVREGKSFTVTPEPF
jgi:organic hydroperoxide reductase OsmC/OhrA